MTGIIFDSIQVRLCYSNHFEPEYMDDASKPDAAYTFEYKDSISIYTIMQA